MRLVYTASAFQFAQDAVEALREAGIDCFHQGERDLPETTELPVPESDEDTSEEPESPEEGSGRLTDDEIFRILDEDAKKAPEEPEKEPDPDPPRRSGLPSIGIYVDKDEDYPRASEILLKLGAVPEESIPVPAARLINRVAVWLGVLTAVLVVLAVVAGR